MRRWGRARAGERFSRQATNQEAGWGRDREWDAGGGLRRGLAEGDAGSPNRAMGNQCTVQVKLELGHCAQLREKPTTEGFTHDWMVFVHGPEQFEIQHFVEKVVFRLNQSFPEPKRVCKEPPYKVEESSSAGFIMPIEIYLKNREEPKRVSFTYDLFLNLEGNPPVNHLRCEKLTFNNPTKDFRRKLIKAGGTMVMPEGSEIVSQPSPDYPTIPLSDLSDPKKTKESHGSKCKGPCLTESPEETGCPCAPAEDTVSRQSSCNC